MKLEEELESCHCSMSTDDFRALLRSTFKEFYGDMPDERLLYRPTEALGFCGIIRQRCLCLGLPEELILRTLANLRKRSEL